MMKRLFQTILTCAIFCAALLPQTIFACATCFGKSDSKLAEGMNWGIFTLLVVVTMVLGGISTFFVYIAKRSANVSVNSPEKVSEPLN